MKRMRKSKTIILLLLILSQAAAFGQNTGFSFGVGGEANIITLDNEGFSVGGGISTDYRFGPVFAAGFKADIFYDMNQLFSFENRIFTRWYFVRPEFMEFFFQGDAGVLLTFIDNNKMQDTRGSASCGLTLGTRVFLPSNWYLEPYVRGGYPFILGGGLVIGVAPKRTRPEPPPEAPPPIIQIITEPEPEPQVQAPPQNQPVVIVREMPERPLGNGEEWMIFRNVSSVPEIAALAIEPYVYFGSNIAGFTGLDYRTVDNNYRLLNALARFLLINPQYDLVIEGHANPVTNDRNEEQISLNPLSIERAEMVARALISYGVDRKRLVIAGSGGVKTLVPWIDRRHWNLNRRVEFMLIQQPGQVGR